MLSNQRRAGTLEPQKVAETRPWWGISCPGLLSCPHGDKEWKGLRTGPLVQPSFSVCSPCREAGRQASRTVEVSPQSLNTTCLSLLTGDG